jgi:hypothetical protein
MLENNNRVVAAMRFLELLRNRDEEEILKNSKTELAREITRKREGEQAKSELVPYVMPVHESEETRFWEEHKPV